MPSTTPGSSACFFCQQPGGNVLWRDDFCRVVVAGDADHPGICRVVLNAHIRDMTDLPLAQRERLMRVVWAVEHALRDALRPHKLNLASLGNQVPHLHWHVIPRFIDDPHFPNPVWGSRTGGRRRPLPLSFQDTLKRALEANPEEG